MKKLLSIVLVLSLVLSLAACGSKDDTKTPTTGETNTGTETTTNTGNEDGKKWEGKKLVIWSFTDELTDATEKFKEMYGAEVELSITPTEDYPNTIKPVLESGVGAPDVYVAEAAFVKEFVNNGFWENLSAAPYNVEDMKADYTGYVFETGRDYDGNIRALSWQMTPGGIFYRRSVAKEVFGTDEPAEISKLLGSMDDLFSTGRKLKDAGYKLFPDTGALRWFTNPDQEAWVDADNKLILSQPRMDYFDYSKQLKDEGMTADAAEWSGAWFGGMYGPIQVGASGEETTVFGYTLPTWGLHYVLKTATPEEGGSKNPTWGDWAVTSGPNAYFWGGTWIGLYSGSEQKEMAWDFVQMIATENDYLKNWLAETGDVTSVIPLQTSAGVSEEFLGGQNHQEYFIEAASNINGDRFTRYDQEIDRVYGLAVSDYVEGLLTKEEAVQSFKDGVKAAYPEIIVD